MKDSKFSFTISRRNPILSRTGDNYSVKDLCNIIENEAIKIAHIIEDIRSIKDANCDEYFGENLYVEGDRGSNIIKAEVETQIPNNQEIAIYNNDEFNTRIYQSEPDNILRLLTSYLNSNKKGNFIKTECDYLNIPALSEDNLTSFNLIVDLSTKHWDVYIGIIYAAADTFTYEMLEITMDKTLNDE